MAALTKNDLLALRPGAGVWADAMTRLRPAAHEQRAKSPPSATPRLEPVREGTPEDDARRKGGQLVKLWSVRVLMPDGPPPTHGTPLANAPFVARIERPAARRIAGQTDEGGVLRLLLHEGEDALFLEIAGRVIKVRAGALQRLDSPDDEQVKLRLYNLGYGRELPAAWDDAEYRFLLQLFQKQHGIDEEEWDTVGPETLAVLERLHDGTP